MPDGRRTPRATGRAARASADHPRRIATPGAAVPVDPVLFHRLAAWTRTPTASDTVRERRLWVAFAERAVVYSESDGASEYTGVWCLEPFLQHFAERLDHVAARWLLPHLGCLAAGVDVRHAVLAAYAERHGGATPPTRTWPLTR